MRISIKYKKTTKNEFNVLKLGKVRLNLNMCHIHSVFMRCLQLILLIIKFHSILICT